MTIDTPELKATKFENSGSINADDTGVSHLDKLTVIEGAWITGKLSVEDFNIAGSLTVNENSNLAVDKLGTNNQAVQAVTVKDGSLINASGDAYFNSGLGGGGELIVGGKANMVAGYQEIRLNLKAESLSALGMTALYDSLDVANDLTLENSSTLIVESTDLKIGKDFVLNDGAKVQVRSAADGLELNRVVLNTNEESYFQAYRNLKVKEIQNKLSGDKYSNVIVLDIIELTEKEGIVGKSWQSLFGDIYNQRESIRYNLGTATERSAINRMMKRRNPNLLEQMADISEREDADQIVLRVQDAIAESEHEAYIKMLGDFVESHIQYYIKSALSDIGVSVENEQGGQDLILSKEGYTNYYIEIKSRWVDKESVVMSQQQFQKAVDNPDNYALISAQMWTFDQNRVQRKENVSLDEMQSRIKVLDNIGYLEADLRRRVDDAFRGEDTDIRAVGTYGVHVPQNVFPASGFGDFIEKLKRYFQTSIS